jgi:hypothetical protein
MNFTDHVYGSSIAFENESFLWRKCFILWVINKFSMFLFDISAILCLVFEWLLILGKLIQEISIIFKEISWRNYFICGSLYNLLELLDFCCQHR